MHAIITAGGCPKPDEPLYPYTRGGYKNLLDIAGKPMVQWVLDALSGSTSVENAVVVGLPPDTPLHYARTLSIIPTRDDLVENILAGLDEVLRLDPAARSSLLVSGDVPGITPQMIDWLTAKIENLDYDLVYLVIEQSIMEKRFPSSNRSYARLKDLTVCGGDVMALSNDMARNPSAKTRALVAARKSVVKQASIIGFDMVTLLLLRQLTLAKAVEIISRRLQFKGIAIVSPYAEMGMDVDKPHQLEIMRADLALKHG